METPVDIQKEFAKLDTKAERVREIKDQIRMRTIGLGWHDLHPGWSKNGTTHSPEYLRDVLIKDILPQEKTRTLPKVPPIDLPSRGDSKQLGTVTADIIEIDKRRANKERELRKGGKKLRDNLEKEGCLDRYEMLQPPRPSVDKTLIDARIEQCHEYYEKNGDKVLVWCLGVVVGVLNNNQVHVKWDKTYLREGDAEITKEKFLKTKWNRHVQNGWRMNVDWC